MKRRLRLAPSRIPASLAGRLRIGGDLEVNRIGYGALRITGPGCWGYPADRNEALRLLRRSHELGVNFIDTANSYGPDTSELLIREALYPYDDIIVATKAGMMRAGPDQWRLNGRPEHLIEQASLSRDKLGVDTIDLWQLHRIDRAVPTDEQFSAIRQLLDEGVIRHAGLSEVSVEDIRAASTYFPVATVQNLYNLANRQSEAVLQYCESQGIAFIPWCPLAAGGLVRPGSVLDQIAHTNDATPAQVALAWVLRRSPVVLAIPGTSSLQHLEENVMAAYINLDDADFDSLDVLTRP